MNVWKRPYPTESPETRPFWEAANAERFIIQRCRRCENWQFPYRGFCCHCWSLGFLEDVEATTGSVFTHSTIFRNDSPGFEAVVPYVATMVQLDTSWLMVMTNIVGCDPGDVYIGMPVQVCFETISDSRKIPMFQPRADG